jgi:hypothetical protein
MRKLLLFCSLIFIGLPATAQQPLKFRDTTVKGPQTFAIILGISKYKYVRPLSFADKDAEMFRDFLRSTGGGSVREDNIFTLLNEQALHSTFWTKGFQWLKAKQLQKGDKLFIYLAGHGDAIDEDQYFFLSYDCNPAGDKNNYLVGGAIQLYNLKKKISNETSKGVDVYFVMDACRSNELPGGQEGLNLLSNAITEKKAGEMMMLATAAGQESLEDKTIGNGHGLFTYYLVDGLSGLADTDGSPDNKVTFSEIRSYVAKNVPSIAQQRFNRKQDPFFCCNEYNSKVVSNVNAAYLQKWMQNKKRGGSNSYSGLMNEYFEADTLLVETYNRFNRAIRSSQLTGSSSAEDYYRQLEAKYPNNPYTLDAKSTLAAELINEAQKKVNDYLACGLVSTSREKQENAAAGSRLEKAISLLREDDPDFASALRGRMFLLKATGDYGNGRDAFNYAHAARAIDPNGAYILNWLSRLHLAANNRDSALYYADRATKAAPKWLCALTTLSLIQNNPTTANPVQPGKPIPKNPSRCRPSFGFTLGGGINRSNPTYSGNANTGFVAVEANTAPSGNLGVLYNLCLGNTISIRPSTTVSFESSDIDFHRRSPTGGPVTIETVSIKGTSVNVSLPLVIRLNSREVAPYLTLGPSFSYMFGQNSSSQDILPIKKSMVLAGGGLGVDIGIPKSGIIIAPEIKYNAGLSDVRDDAASTPANAALSSLKRNSFTLTVSVRKR